ncbi:MAG TPA: MlaD family protein [Candidatus Methylomirabilis sp.]|nr:MlaD family protein [Candidatus Methylomirabilis sp.]
MSTRPNPTVIGAFVVGAIVLLLVALLVWGGTGFLRTKLNYVLFFNSDVTGLNKGAPVLFRGVKVGEVTDIQIRWGTPLVAVYIALEPEALKGTVEGGAARRIEQVVREGGLRAQLRMQSFVTGVLFIAFENRPDTPIVLRGQGQKVPELPTIPTDIEVWTAKLERFAEKIDKIPLEQIGQTAAVMLDDARKILESKDTQDLLRNANGALAEARTLVQRVDGKIDPLVAQLNDTLARVDAGFDAVRKLALDVDNRVDPLATQAEATLKTAQVAVGDVRPLIEDLRHIAAKLDAQVDPLLTSFRGTLDGAQVTLRGVDRTLDQESPLGFELFQTLKEFRTAAQALRALADYLERVPDAPVYGVRRPSGGAK